MKNLAIIPARSGSKGIINKNIKLLNGKPLLAYSIEAAKETGIFNEIMVSTDSEKYAEIANQWGANVPFLRNTKLSDDNASSWDVVIDVINRYKDSGIEFDTVALLQPTSPLRTPRDIITGYSVMEKNNANLVVGVCEMDHSPLWANILPINKSMEEFINPDIVKTTRQNISKYYRINGALYIIKVNYLMNSQNIYANKSFATIMTKENSVDIDDTIDFSLAEVLINNLD